ncbi:MAG: hypothetical protein Q8909_16605 [Bacteroidota bacterium]|nr:hypothetical protein [Bacteroidota bacterium]
MKKHFVLLNLFFLILVACNSSYEDIEKIPAVVNKYDSSKPTAASAIDPTWGIIDQPFILKGNFPGLVSGMKVYFGKKKAVLVGTNGESITGLVPKEPNGYNQISLVIGKDSIVPANLKFKYRQSRSVKTIAGKLGTDKWMDDAAYAGAALDAVTFGEVHYVATVAGQKNDNILMIESGWGNKLFLLSQDDNKIQKLSTPTNLCSPAVPSTRDRFFTTKFWDGDHTIYMYSKESSWSFVSAGVVVAQTDFPAQKVPSMTFAEDDNLLYLLDTEGRIAEVNLTDKSYKIYTTASKKPANIKSSNFGGTISGTSLPTNFGNWEDSYICYSKYHKCFFVTYTTENAIYKYVKNEDGSWTCSLYAGHNGPGSTVGDRLKDAQFTNPHGIVVNADGDIFVCNKGGCAWCSNGHVINRISGDAVEIVAGNAGSNGPLTNGTNPLESTFNEPRNLAIDFEGNYYIAGGSDRTVRKLSIE